MSTLPRNSLCLTREIHINPILGDPISVLKMLRPVHLILLVSIMVLVSCSEIPLKPSTTDVQSPLQNANDLNADATAYGYGNPWRYGSYGSWGGRRNGWNGNSWGGRGWSGRSGWW